MSSILKALRKLEDEKATLGEGSVDLAHDILKRSYDENKSTPWFAVTLIVAVLVILGGIVWWFYVAPIESQSPSVAVQPPTQSKAVIVQPPLKVKAPEQDTIVPAQKTTQATALLSENTLIQRPPVENQVTPVPVTAPLAVTNSEPIDIPLLEVEEIVYHQQPDSRLAVINDLPVMEGTDIMGAHVDEILPDRVRFTFKGVRFNKFLSSRE